MPNFRSVYLFFIVTGVLCLAVKIVYHIFRNGKPNGLFSFNGAGMKMFIAILYGFFPLIIEPDNSKETRIRKALNYGLYYYYAVVIVFTIGQSRFDKILQAETPPRTIKAIDSSSYVKPLSDSEKSAIKDSFNLEMKRGLLK